MWFDLGRWSISEVAAIWEDSRVDSGDQLVSLPGDIGCRCHLAGDVPHLVCQEDVRAASVLPLEPQPVVSRSKDSSVEELHDSMVSEKAGLSMAALVWAVLESGLFGQMS